MSMKPKKPPMPAAGGRYIRQQDGTLVAQPAEARPSGEVEGKAEQRAPEQSAPDAAAKKGK